MYKKGYLLRQNNLTSKIEKLMNTAMAFLKTPSRCKSTHVFILDEENDSELCIANVSSKFENSQCLGQNMDRLAAVLGQCNPMSTILSKSA